LRYWYDVLRMERLDVKSDGYSLVEWEEDRFVSSFDLYQYYIKYFNRSLQYQTHQVHEVVEGLKDVCPSAISNRKQFDGNQKRGFLLPNITKAREEFESKIGSKITWD